MNVADMIGILTQGVSPVFLIVVALMMYFINDLKSKLNKVQEIDVLVVEIRNLVTKLDDMVQSQKQYKVSVDAELNKLDKEVDNIKSAINNVQHRLVALETIAELEKLEKF